MNSFLEIEAGDNEYNNKDNKINKKRQKKWINYKKKKNTTTKGNKMEKKCNCNYERNVKQR